MSKIPPPLRLDRLLMKRFPALTRSRARAEIMAGRVLLDGRVCDKPGTLVSPDAELTLRPAENPYVSRGGLKLAGALEVLPVTVRNRVVLDVGASTGGFTDCLLQKGARRVIALDVGYGQLDWNLRRNPAVTVLERFNIRRLKAQDLPEPPELATVDVSFISLKLVLPVLAAAGIGAVLALVKPQFEAGRAAASRGRGVIRDPALHRAVLADLAAFACRTGYCCAGVTYSPLPGPRGNIEFFIYWVLNPGSCRCPAGLEETLGATVDLAHRSLKNGPEARSNKGMDTPAGE